MTKHYEHRISPTDPQVVLVREKKAQKKNGGRGIGWRIYYEAYSPQDAQRILSMLEPDNVEATVLP